MVILESIRLLTGKALIQTIELTKGAFPEKVTLELVKLAARLAGCYREVSFVIDAQLLERNYRKESAFYERN